MRFPRSSGILFHPTSLPSRYGIGDLGPSAIQFIDFLAQAGQTLWQILPLGPLGYGNSPYQSPSAFAGNPLLISPDRLVEEGLLSVDDISAMPGHFLIEDRVNYDVVASFKMPLLSRSFEIFRQQQDTPLAAAFDEFCANHESWLKDYALFMSLKQHFPGAWNTWDHDIALRKPAALKEWESKLADNIALQKYLQFIFFRQWSQLKAYANSKNIRIIGDIPIYVAYDSADVWANSHLFKLDSAGNPTVVAGVPPDYFSKDGQRWGNPIYQWDQMAKKGFAWWVERLRMTLSLVDIVRIDHFRGLEDYWEIPAEEETAKKGTWVKGPGASFLNKIKRVFGDLPIIAEDLGEITPEVEQLREKFDIPGMKILQFAFGDTSENPYLPHNYQNNCVVYTGTHDNNTTLGWFESIENIEQERVQCYLGRDGSDISWDMIRLALASVADVSIIPLQDVLRLGSEARMNTPGSIKYNWEWRLRSKMLTPGLAFGLRLLTETYSRYKKVDEPG